MYIKKEIRGQFSLLASNHWKEAHNPIQILLTVLGCCCCGDLITEMYRDPPRNENHKLVHFIIKLIQLSMITILEADVLVEQNKFVTNIINRWATIATTISNPFYFAARGCVGEECRNEVLYCVNIEKDTGNKHFTITLRHTCSTSWWKHHHLSKRISNQKESLKGTDIVRNPSRKTYLFRSWISK